MLFTYKNCQCCRKDKTNLMVVLNNILPSAICNEICDYNLYCFKCRDLQDKERRYLEYSILKMTKPQKQIHFFKTRMEASPVDIAHNSIGNVRKMTQQIDELMGNERLKQQYKNNKLFLLACKTYLKKCLSFTNDLLRFLHDLDSLKAISFHWTHHNLERYRFRNREFIIKDFIEVFLNAYTEELFKHYEHYLVDKTDIRIYMIEIMKLE